MFMMKKAAEMLYLLNINFLVLITPGSVKTYVYLAQHSGIVPGYGCEGLNLVNQGQLMQGKCPFLVSSVLSLIPQVVECLIKISLMPLTFYLD